jgi:hypothetical protein
MTLPIDYLKAVDDALARKDVAAALSGSELAGDLDFLRSGLLEEELEIRGLMAPLLQKHDDIESQISDVEKSQEALRTPKGWAGGLETMIGFLLLAAMAAAIGWLVGYNFAWDFVREAFTSRPITWGQFAIVASLLIILIVVEERIRWQLVRLPRIKARIAADPRLDSLRKEKADLEGLVETQLQNLVTASAFEIVGTSVKPFFQARLVRKENSDSSSAMRLRISSASGLSEVADKTHETPTVARREILKLLNELPGASIGLSGPRGAGKSTVLRSLTAANLPLRDKEAIAIYTAAPVEYEARDFLLHLYSTLCRQVLRTHGTTEEQDPDALSASDAAMAEWFAKIGRIAPLFLWIGLLFAGFGALLAAISAAGPERSNLFQLIDLKPGPLLLFGLVALLMGYALRVYARFAERSGAARTRSFFYTIYPWLRPKASETEPETELVTLTRKELRDIRFQRSFTSGWSGAIKIPAGFELGATRTSSLAQRQESFPELVDRFCRYVARVAAEHGAVVIAVDELDKLKTAEEAEKFINGVKSIFAIPKCFYLISVSEDALSAFERRGLALRDAFDSAFDDIRYIGYKLLPGSRQLLARRILNLPDPFLCLCHVLSGGLPRDLIRIARAMFQADGAAGKPATIREMARRLAHQEAAAKIRASRTAIRNSLLEPETGAFASALADLEEYPIGTERWRGTVKKLEAQFRADADPPAFAKLVLIQRELVAYLDFLDVCLILADRLGTQEGWTAVVRKDVEALARARQALESNVSVGAARLEKVRLALNESQSRPARKQPKRQGSIAVVDKRRGSRVQGTTSRAGTSRRSAAATSSTRQAPGGH